MAADNRSCAICSSHVKSGVGTQSKNSGTVTLCPPCIVSVDRVKVHPTLVFLPTN